MRSIRSLVCLGTLLAFTMVAGAYAQQSESEQETQSVERGEEEQQPSTDATSSTPIEEITVRGQQTPDCQLWQWN